MAQRAAHKKSEPFRLSIGLLIQSFWILGSQDVIFGVWGKGNFASAQVINNLFVYSSYIKTKKAFYLKFRKEIPGPKHFQVMIFQSSIITRCPRARPCPCRASVVTLRNLGLAGTAPTLALHNCIKIDDLGGREGKNIINKKWSKTVNRMVVKGWCINEKVLLVGFYN